MCSARAATVPSPQTAAAILWLMCSPMFQYRSISSLLTAATARTRAASIRHSTSSNSAGEGAARAVGRGNFGFRDLATGHLLAVPQLTWLAAVKQLDIGL